MRIIFSSFLVGLVTSTYGVMTLNATIQERKHFLEPQFNEEEFRSFLYQSELKQKLQDKKFAEEGTVKKEARKFISEKVVPTVRDAVNTVFSLPVQDIVDDIIKKFTDNKGN